MNARLLIVLLLGFSSGVPFALLNGTLQAWFADAGLPVMTTGFLSLLGLPYAYRFLFAPIVDRCAFLNWGRRRGAMFLTQSLLVVGLNLLVCFEPNQRPQVIMGIAFCLAWLSAMQDLVIDAQRIEYLPVCDHGMGAFLGVFGYRIAMILIGGGALILAAQYGWNWTYRALSGVLLLGIGAAWWSQEPDEPVPIATLSPQDWTSPIKEWISRPGWAVLLGFIFFYKLGEAFTTISSGVMMPFLRQGMGFSLQTIGYVNQGGGVIALLFGGFVAAWWLKKHALKPTLFCFGIVQACSNVMFLVLAWAGQHLWLLVATVLIDNMAAGMGSTALVALLMRVVDHRYTATQFSLLIAISVLPRILSGPLAATLVHYHGWVGMYAWSVFLSFLFIPFFRKIQIDEKGVERLGPLGVEETA